MIGEFEHRPSRRHDRRTTSGRRPCSRLQSYPEDIFVKTANSRRCEKSRATVQKIASDIDLCGVEGGGEERRGSGAFVGVREVPKPTC